jgi:hypothetical protein
MLKTVGAASLVAHLIVLHAESLEMVYLFFSIL